MYTTQRHKRFLSSSLCVQTCTEDSSVSALRENYSANTILPRCWGYIRLHTYSVPSSLCLTHAHAALSVPTVRWGCYYSSVTMRLRNEPEAT
jgi:hypothetical protein